MPPGIGYNGQNRRKPKPRRVRERKTRDRRLKYTGLASSVEEAEALEDAFSSTADKALFGGGRRRKDVEEFRSLRNKVTGVARPGHEQDMMRKLLPLIRNLK
tara:strand:+ start:193 stop:498 length:306 start_codon:yes stop_codon:yes gene_type:complete